jgi:hypothetical protein
VKIHPESCTLTAMERLTNRVKICKMGLFQEAKVRASRVLEQAQIPGIYEIFRRFF